MGVRGCRLRWLKHEVEDVEIVSGLGSASLDHPPLPEVSTCTHLLDLVEEDMKVG